MGKNHDFFVRKMRSERLKQIFGVKMGNLVIELAEIRGIKLNISANGNNSSGCTTKTGG